MKNKVFFYSTITAFICLLAIMDNVAVFAQHDHHGDKPQKQPTETFTASAEKSFAVLMDEAMRVMENGMKGAPMTGDPDHDFAAMMIPHHQGAADMAKVELLYGKDPVLRRLAQEIIVTQQQEIEVMRMRLKQEKAK